jgi:hypothetical protein
LFLPLSFLVPAVRRLGEQLEKEIGSCRLGANLL